MNPVLQRLYKLDPSIDQNSILKPNADLYIKLAPQTSLLVFEYNVLINQLSEQLSSINPENVNEMLELAKALLVLAKMLEHIHKYYLNVPQDAENFRKQQKIYKDLLKKFNQGDNTAEECQTIGNSFSRIIRDTTARVNWYRLITVRSIRILELLDKLCIGNECFHAFILSLGIYISPIIPYVTAIYFLPRLFINLAMLIKHAFPWRRMSEEEQSLGWLMRLQIHFERRWFELGNDIPWALIGILNCVYFIGALTPIGNYIAFVFYVYDVVIADARVQFEWDRHNELKNEYVDLLSKEKDPIQRRALQEYIEHFDARMHYESLRFEVPLVQAIGVLIGMSLFLPIFTTNLVMHLIGAVILLAVCFVTWGLSSEAEKVRPKEDIEKPSAVTKIGFFAEDKINHSLDVAKAESGFSF